jgi:hypothetical protein
MAGKAKARNGAKLRPAVAAEAAAEVSSTHRRATVGSTTKLLIAAQLRASFIPGSG